MFRKTLYWTVLTAFILSACGGQPPATVLPATESLPTTVTAVTITTVPSTKTSLLPTPTTAALITPTFVNAPDCTDSAAFVVDVTVPDNESMDQGKTFNKIWRIKNTGTCTWTSAYTLVFKKGEQMDAADSMPLRGETSPAASLDVAVDLIAPTISAIYRADFEIHDPSGKAISIDRNTVLWVIITVGSASVNSGGGTPEGGSGGGTGGTTTGPGFATVNCDFTLNPAKIESVIAVINTYRTNNGFTPYTVNADLTRAAQAHSNDMACNGLFVHTGSNGSTPQSRVAFSGYSASSVSENVYGNYPDPTGQDVVNWWAADQSDPRHNQNLLSTKFTEIGIGYSFYKNFGYYVVVFATP